MENNTNRKLADTPWLEGYMKPSFPTLEENKRSDVVILGGGIAGILSAYVLAEAGKKVILIEKNKLGEGTTAYTTGFLTEALDTNMKDLYKMFGREDTHTVIDAHRKAIDLIEELVRRHNIECEFVRCGNYIYADTEEEAIGLEEELIYYKRIKSEASFEEGGTQLGFPNAGYLQIKNQAKLHLVKFVVALAEEARKLGVQIYENTEARQVSPGLVSTNMGVIEAEWVLVLTYKPFNKELYFKKGTYISYIFELEVNDCKLPGGIYEDTKNPYHYIRVDKLENKTRVIIGGEDHRKDIPVDETKNYNALHKYAERIFGKGNFTVVRKWNGSILEPVDGLASLGEAHKGEKILYAVGFSGNGITYSGIAAMLFKDIIFGNENKLERILNPLRAPSLYALGIKTRDYLSVLAGGAAKNFFKEKKRPEF